MEDLVLSCLESRVEENRNLYARFLVGPFLKGEALTVATALRRVLLSSIESIGITALYIQGITHEFSTIVGVRESVLELSLNFGAIVLSYDKTFFQKKGFFDKLQIGYLQIQGPKVVYANHLKLPLGVKLVDPTQYIATVSKEGSIVLKFVIGKRNNSLYQNTGSESHFGDQTKDFSIVGEVGKRNIAKAKKKHSYKNGSTIEPFHQLKPCKSAFVRLQSKAVRPSGHKQAELSFDLPILSGGVRHSRDMSKLFVEQLKKQTFDNISLHRSSWQGHCKESSTSHAKRSKGVAKTTLRFVTPLLHKILFRKSFKKSSQKIGFAQPLLSNLLEGKASSTGVKSRTRTCTLSSLRKTSVFEGKKPCFSLFFPCVQNPANKSSYKSYTSKALNKAFTRRTNTNLCPEQSLYKAMLCKALLGQRFVRSFVCLVSKTELCTGNTITNPLAKQSFALVLQRLLLRSKSMFCTSFVNQRPCMKNHSFATLLQSKGVQSLAKHRYKAFERNWKTVERKSDSLKGDLVFLNEQLQKKKERKTKKTEIKQRRLNFLSSNNVFRSDVCLRNVIPLDLTLNPVLKVNFVVEIDDEVLYLRQKIRERIILEVWTNGSIHPRQAVHDSSLRLLDMFASFRSIYQVASA